MTEKIDEVKSGILDVDVAPIGFALLASIFLGAAVHSLLTSAAPFTIAALFGSALAVTLYAIISAIYLALARKE